ncbi:NETI motif-containing protein [Niallia sp. Krafla_26]|uniref:NETI motif-containing protein n=1 Tax=Niallia sp. Krafla_26 TaxID=3064703 RepID=UPI003D174E4A
MASKKKIYEVEENETVNDCLNRIQNDGYMPVKRIEKPIFQEKVSAGQVSFEPAGRKIIFEAKIIE